MQQIFNPYRYFIIPNEKQITIESHLKGYLIEDKAQMIKDFFKELKTVRKRKIGYKNREYLLYYIEHIQDRYVILKIAREKENRIHDPGEFDIKESSRLDYPYSIVLVDLVTQKILIEHNSEAFSNTKSVANRLVQFFNEFSNRYNYEVKLNDMLTEEQFWNSVSKYESISGLHIVLESPNLFDGLFDVEELLRKLKNEYNNTETEMKLKNENGGIVINEKNDDLKSMIDYASQGGGRWSLLGWIKGKKKSIHSHQNQQHIVSEPPVNELIENKEEKIIYLFDRVKDVMGNEKKDKK